MKFFPFECHRFHCLWIFKQLPCRKLKTVLLCLISNGMHFSKTQLPSKHLNNLGDDANERYMCHWIYEMSTKAKDWAERRVEKEGRSKWINDKFFHWIKNTTNCVTNCLHVWSSSNIWIINKHYTEHEAHISIWIHLMNIERNILWFQIRKCFFFIFFGNLCRHSDRQLTSSIYAIFDWIVSNTTNRFIFCCIFEPKTSVHRLDFFHLFLWVNNERPLI